MQIPKYSRNASLKSNFLELKEYPYCQKLNVKLSLNKLVKILQSQFKVGMLLKSKLKRFLLKVFQLVPSQYCRILCLMKSKYPC